MGDRIRRFDWAATPLGVPGGWPQPLRSALSICLHSSFPTAIYRGPELRLLYNDAWAPVPAARHPQALGRPARDACADIWHVIGPQLDKVNAHGARFPTFARTLPWVREGAGRRSETP